LGRLGSIYSDGAGRRLEMVITVLEGRVADDRRQDLEDAYREGTEDLPQDIVETFLVRDNGDSTAHRIVTVWASPEALERTRSSAEKPKGVQIFEAARVSPTLTILDVVAHRRSE
jgi:hypothetical protein